jgi:sugar lactone lactonase YvrE
MKTNPVLLSCLFLSGCTNTSVPETSTKAASLSLPEIRAELIASDPSWGNTEGAALDSKNNLYFCSRGTWKGIVRWNRAEGAQHYADVATMAGPGGLWIDDADNIFLTATDERELWKLSPTKQVTISAKAGFEGNPKLAKGPNDVVTAKNGIIYFTDPNGYYGDAPNGTIYWIDHSGKTKVFSAAITGPNGIILSLDEKALYVSHNIAKATSRITSWKVNDDGSAGEMREFATVPDCVADGIAIDTEGALWLTCYSFGAAYRLAPGGRITHKITTDQKALTNIKFGRGTDNQSLYLTSSDMDRVTGYIYRAAAPVPGPR